MSNILDKIIADKRKEVSLKKLLIPTSQLDASILTVRETVSLKNNLLKSTSGIIAEHKRRSPSKSEISYAFSVDNVVSSYTDAGVCGISILTDGKYFGGSLDDLLLARATTNLPLLRKDFVIDEYQILEAKAYGADLILLIASCLTPTEIKRFAAFAKSLQLEVLLEVHDLQELQRSITPNLDMIGVNNRNLKTFEVSLNNSIELSDKIPSDFVKVSESGITTAQDVLSLQQNGYKGFLIGENFMKSANPREVASAFIAAINKNNR